LKSRGTKHLNSESIHPLAGENTPWAAGHWEVFLDTEDEVHQAVEYVEQNPVQAGQPRQEWPFVVSIYVDR